MRVAEGDFQNVGSAATQALSGMLHCRRTAKTLASGPAAAALTSAS